MDSMDLLVTYNEETFQKVSKMEMLLDEYQDQLSTYMIKLSKVGLGDHDSKRIAKLLHTIDDFERIGDHAINLALAAKQIDENNTTASLQGRLELLKMTEALTEILNITAQAFCKTDLDLAATVEPLEQVIDDLIYQVRRNHIARLQNGTCTIQHGFILNDILTSYSRVSDHCSNIAVAVIESQHGTFDTHEYLDSVKDMDNPQFRITFDENILWRDQDITLTTGIGGTPVLPADTILMEVKTADAIPLWLVQLLSREKIYKTSFSKYGTAWLQKQRRF